MREITSPIASSGRSSTLLKRTQHYPMSSFLPAFRNCSRSQASSSESW
jgi:hypothetical protein